jgi:hypothetical protein
MHREGCRLGQEDRHRRLVTSLQESNAEHLYETVYCARGSSSTKRNFRPIAPVAVRRWPTRCGSSCTGAYWLLLDLRAAIPSWNPPQHTEFATIRLRLLKIAGRIIETASRIRIALASCCPEAETFSLVALKLQPSGP